MVVSQSTEAVRHRDRMRQVFGAGARAVGHHGALSAVSVAGTLVEAPGSYPVGQRAVVAVFRRLGRSGVEIGVSSADGRNLSDAPAGIREERLSNRHLRAW